MERSPNIPPIFALPRDTATSDALLHDVHNLLKDNKAYQLAALEQQNQLHGALNELNRSLLTDRERRHSDVEEVSLQIDGLRDDLNQFFVHSFRSARRGSGRRALRRPRRVQTPRPAHHPLGLTDSESSSGDTSEDDVDPAHRRYPEPPFPTRGSYTPAPTHPVMPGTTAGGSHIPTPSIHLRPGSRQHSSRGSSGLTYITDNPVLPSLPPGFVPYPGQIPPHRQNPFPTPHVPFQQSPFHSAPVLPPPQIRRNGHRASSDSQSE